MAIKIEMLRCFATVAREGSLAGAAAALGRTPSAISMMLAQFEQHIGAPLFEAERKSRLTPLGRTILEEAERTLSAFEGGVAAIERQARSQAGTVRIAAVPSASITLLPAAIARFRQTHPAVRLEVSDVDSTAVVRRLDFDEADIGIASSPAPPRLVSEELLIDVLGIVCLRGGSVACAPASLGWAALRLEPFIGNTLCGLVDDPVVRELHAGCALTARNTTTLLTFVRSGLGTTILPERALSAEEPDLTFIKPPRVVSPRRLLLLRSAGRRLSPAGEALCGTLRAAAAEAADQPAAEGQSSTTGS